LPNTRLEFRYVNPVTNNFGAGNGGTHPNFTKRFSADAESGQR
jgi:hypothetical protein